MPHFTHRASMTAVRLDPLRHRNGCSMTTAVEPRQRLASRAATAAEHRPADVFVPFGITGDLAKQMTFRSLYRLERRGLLSCPIVGVAVDDWSARDLRERAREAIAAREAMDAQVF